MLPDVTSILTAIAALGVVLALVLLAARLARAGGLAARPTAGRLLAVEEVLALDARRRLHLLRCGNHRVLLLTGGAGDVVVGWMPETTDGDGMATGDTP